MRLIEFNFLSVFFGLFILYFILFGLEYMNQD